MPACDPLIGTGSTCCPSSNGQTIDSLTMHNLPTEDIDIVSIATKGSPLLSIIATSARKRIDGTYSSEFSIRERFWTHGMEYKFKEYDDFSEFFTLAAPAAAAATVLTLTSNAGIVVGQIMINSITGEQVRVTAVDTVGGTDITVQRGFGTTVAAAMLAGETIMLVSVALGCGCVGTDDVAVTARDQNNYFQKLVTTLRSTDCLNFINNDIANISIMDAPGLAQGKLFFVAHKALEHAKQFEKALLYSQKNWDATSSIGTPEGIHQLTLRSGNVADISAAPTLANLTAALTPVFKHGNPDMRYLLIGENVDPVLYSIIEAYKLQQHGCCDMAFDGIDMSFTEIKLIGGQRIRVVRHPYMGIGTPLANFGLVLDPTQLKLVYSLGQDLMGQKVDGTTKLVKVDNESNYACQVYNMVTYFSLHNGNAQAHGIIKFA
jgi:hypothetical protein